MDPVVAAALASWRLDPWLLCGLFAAAWIYARGFVRLHREMPRRYPAWRCSCFVAGVASVFIALESPLDAFGGLLLEVHMLQHLLLLMVAPPLLWLAQPVLALVRGLPRPVVKDALGPFLAWDGLRRFGRALSHPLLGWFAMAAAIVGWHLPRSYELGLHSQSWHEVQHACFFSAAMLFWWPVIDVWPSHARWPRWAMIPYLVAADVVNTALSAYLSFSDHVLYPTYQIVPRIWGISALDDQAAAGAIMWVPGSIAFLLPAVVLAVQAFDSGRRVRAELPLPAFARERPRRWDLLKMPLLGAIMGHRHFRRIAQTVMLALAAALVFDGLFGPQASPLNLAGVLPWTYWRGLAVIALLAAGNLFCMACPFTLPRDIGRRWLPVRYHWPRRLRSKWLAIGLLALYLWSYEAFSLWNSPWWTAWIAIGYFVTAFLVDGLFQGASFCKYVCPIGQFHFVQSLVSPLQVSVRAPAVCASCQTHDCLHGNDRHRGCELHLFQPKKTSNLDCTFCLDCVHACPSGNVGIHASPPGAGVLSDRSFFHRRDVAALVLILVFGAFVNAAGMTDAVMMWMREWHAFSMLAYAGALVIVPLALAWFAGRFVLALVPLGFSMWLAHFSFHLFAGWRTIVPVIDRLLGRSVDYLAGSQMGSPPAFELLVLDCGLLATLYLAWRIATAERVQVSAALRMIAPWAVLAMALYAAGVWIILQPMQMRGMVMN